MSELSVNRTLVKSPPELWSELSEVERLANHLGEFGEIRINRLEPEHTVAWEGEHACGTVELEASGWGTKVTLRAEVIEPEAEEPPAPAAQPAPPPPTVHSVIPDLDAWDRSAAEIESHAQRQTAAAQRAAQREAEREAERAQRERKGGLARWLFRSRRHVPEPATARPPSPSPAPSPAPRTTAHWSDELQAPTAPAPEVAAPPPPPPAPGPAVDEDRVREVLEAALDNLGSAHHRPFSRG